MAHWGTLNHTQRAMTVPSVLCCAGIFYALVGTRPGNWLQPAVYAAAGASAGQYVASYIPPRGRTWLLAAAALPAGALIGCTLGDEVATIAWEIVSALLAALSLAPVKTYLEAQWKDGFLAGG